MKLYSGYITFTNGFEVYFVENEKASIRVQMKELALLNNNLTIKKAVIKEYAYPEALRASRVEDFTYSLKCRVERHYERMEKK